jgi:hypothetical protein
MPVEFNGKSHNLLYKFSYFQTPLFIRYSIPGLPDIERYIRSRRLAQSPSNNTHKYLTVKRLFYLVSILPLSHFIF